MQLSKPLIFIAILLLIAWMVVLCKFILFKHPAYVYQDYFLHEFPKYSVRQGWEKANIIPFKTILGVLNHPSIYTFKINNNTGNIAGFIPLGLLLPILFTGLRTFRKIILTIFFISLFFESTQLILGTGIFDVDDLMLNSFGGMIGYLLCRIIFLRKQN